MSHMGQDDVELSRAKQVGEKLWFNRLLHELSIEPHLVHEAVQRTGPDAILDVTLDFVQVTQALNLMRTAAAAGKGDALDGLTYGEQVELAKKLAKKREETAMALLRCSVAAWKKLRYPPLEVAERIMADPSQRKVWNMQVRCRHS